MGNKSTNKTSEHIAQITATGLALIISKTPSGYVAEISGLGFYTSAIGDTLDDALSAAYRDYIADKEDRDE